MYVGPDHAYITTVVTQCLEQFCGLCFTSKLDNKFQLTIVTNPALTHIRIEPGN